MSLLFPLKSDRNSLFLRKKDHFIYRCIHEYVYLENTVIILMHNSVGIILVNILFFSFYCNSNSSFFKPILIKHNNTNAKFQGKIAFITDSRYTFVFRNCFIQISLKRTMIMKGEYSHNKNLR